MPMLSSNRPCSRTSDSVRLYTASILRVSRMPIVMPKLRRRAGCQHGLSPALDLVAGETVRVGAVAAGEVDQVHVGQLAGVVHRTPGAADRVQVGREHAVGDGLLERLAEVRREEV